MTPPASHRSKEEVEAKIKTECTSKPASFYWSGRAKSEIIHAVIETRAE